eukprot:CAMPEP_0183344280 /NCGR_PEP_ID=MMETSP0164_2-20130417/10010_1 /TAXON_ID=221442 /ORGANISM="Coccolithus pelagicus ssp braarudi, Strain PLY182g" /LENGTH=34 /DNA_ID= /DNA_START= /DNA_END= /DNA_ORIENTATION=
MSHVNRLLSEVRNRSVQERALTSAVNKRWWELGV